jgi:DNA-3-methyladenine glycosylase
VTGTDADAAGQPESLDAILAGPVFEVAERMLGCRVRTAFDGETVEVVLNEVEAYAGADDPASHAYRGKTARNASMFGPTGTLYVYRSYGIHWCMNVVVGGEGLPHAVLLRGGDVVTGRTVAERRRGRPQHLADGPGKLCQALAVTGDHDGTSVFDGPVRILPGAAPRAITRTPRVGISVAVDRPWRYVAGDPGGPATAVAG